ncbi:hypothetical protein DIPPA_19853 [Diplonema papillatum]|nr:hypothetical protein DIPPA_19853 [Diplonema papillatum]
MWRCVLLACLAVHTAAGGDAAADGVRSGVPAAPDVCSGAPEVGPCELCSDGEADSAGACAATQHRRLTCVDKKAVYESCSPSVVANVPWTKAPAGNTRSVLTFEALCLTVTLVSGVFMRHRKAVLIAQQRSRYAKLMDQT